jgi:DNA processing protein
MNLAQSPLISRKLTDHERIDWLRLTRSDNIGPRTFRGLMQQYGSAGAALEALPELIRTSQRRITIASKNDAEREIDKFHRLKGRFIACGEPDYPKALQAIDSAPPLLAVRGAPDILSKPCVAIVGSRNASASGLNLTERMAQQLGAMGYVIVSGLARGIDAKAHKASVTTGTIAVLAGGHERIYPSDHVALVEAIIAEGGAVLSEMPLAWEPRARDFPRRNRLVSGLSYGVVVIEAARRSGSLITARFALEQGREVFAVPGSPLDPRSEGTNDLIRDGATLCASAEHVASAVEPLIQQGYGAMQGVLLETPQGLLEETPLWDESDIFLPHAYEAAFENIDDVSSSSRAPDEMIRDLLSHTPITIDDLARQSGLPVRMVSLALMELEIAGQLERHTNNSVSLRPLLQKVHQG